MTKITLQDLTSLTNEQSAINLINTNNDVIEVKSDTFLSRDGTNPNQMLADLDMNSRRILNLPAPASGTEPVRKMDIPSETQVGDISGAVEDAEAAAALAQAAAASAASSAANAATNADKLKGTSATTTNISLGSKTFTTQSGKFFDEGIWLLITSNANESNYMHGVSTAYTGTSLTFNVTNLGGSGSFSDWTIRLSGTQGARGDPGTQGPPGVTGGSFFPVARVVATSHVNTGTDLETGDSIDGVTLAAGDVVLLTAQNTPAQNGLYAAVASGAASRLTNYTTYQSIAGCYVAVMEGTIYFDTLWFCSSNLGGVIEASPLVFQQHAGGKNYTNTEKNQITTNIGFTNGFSVTAQANTDLNDVSGWTVDIVGTTNISAITLNPGRTRTVRFTSPLILINGVNLVLPGNSNINVLTGDVAVFQGYSGGIVRCLNYERADGTTLKIGNSLDSVDGNSATKGAVLYRGTSAWASLPPAPGAVQRALVNTGTGTDPSWGQVDLTQVTGNLATARLNSGTNALNTTFWRGDGQWAAPAGGGDVVGPGSAITDCVATYNGTTGKIIKDSTVSLTSTAMGRLPSGFDFNDQNGNEVLTLSSVASAVNEVSIGNAAAGGRPAIVATGNDSNIELILAGKGNKGVILQGDTSGGVAPATYVGEFFSLTSGVVGLTSDVGAMLITHVLTPGDWHISGAAVYSGSGTANYLLAAVHTTSGAVNSSAYGYSFYTGFYVPFPLTTFVGAQAPTIQLIGGRISVSTNTNIYLNVQAGLTAACNSLGHLEIRRMR